MERIAHYEIQSRLGGGGMGEVWKAYDPKLQRTVAIKVLHDTEDAASRILAEARAASKLNHNHICTVYDVGEADGQSFIVMEHVEGKPLSELIPCRRTATRERHPVRHPDRRCPGARPRARDRASGSQERQRRHHARGAGQADRLRDRGAVAVCRMPTLVTRTMESPVSSAPVGTLAYMAPEVLNGQEATARSDIWSLGCCCTRWRAGGCRSTGDDADWMSRGRLRRTLTEGVARAVCRLGLRNVIVERCLTEGAGKSLSRVVSGRCRQHWTMIQSDTAP